MTKMTLSNIAGVFSSLKLAREKLTKVEAKKQVASMVRDLEAATPVDTGYAKSRWNTKEVGNDFSVENDAEYIQHLNMGTSKQAPSHFIERIALAYGDPVGTVVEVKDS